jgi:hypothetical protein
MQILLYSFDGEGVFESFLFEFQPYAADHLLVLYAQGQHLGLQLGDFPFVFAEFVLRGFEVEFVLGVAVLEMAVLLLQAVVLGGEAVEF